MSSLIMGVDQGIVEDDEVRIKSGSIMLSTLVINSCYEINVETNTNLKQLENVFLSYKRYYINRFQSCDFILWIESCQKFAYTVWLYFLKKNKKLKLINSGFFFLKSIKQATFVDFDARLNSFYKQKQTSICVVTDQQENIGGR